MKNSDRSELTIDEATFKLETFKNTDTNVCMLISLANYLYDKYDFRHFEYKLHASIFSQSVTNPHRLNNIV